jgi:hypothetical protein
MSSTNLPMTLLIAICLELIAFAAMIEVAGVKLGLSVLAVVLICLVTSVYLDRHKAKLARSRRVWIYYPPHPRGDSGMPEFELHGRQPSLRFLNVANLQTSRRMGNSLGRN